MSTFWVVDGFDVVDEFEVLEVVNKDFLVQNHDYPRLLNLKKNLTYQLLI